MRSSKGFLERKFVWNFRGFEAPNHGITLNLNYFTIATIRENESGRELPKDDLGRKAGSVSVTKVA